VVAFGSPAAPFRRGAGLSELASKLAWIGQDQRISRRSYFAAKFVDTCWTTLEPGPDAGNQLDPPSRSMAVDSHPWCWTDEAGRLDWLRATADRTEPSLDFGNFGFREEVNHQAALALEDEQLGARRATSELLEEDLEGGVAR